MSIPTKISWGVTEAVNVPIDTPARRVAAALARSNIHILVMFGDSSVGNLRDLAILEGDFAIDVLRAIENAIKREA